MTATTDRPVAVTLDDGREGFFTDDGTFVCVSSSHGIVREVFDRWLKPAEGVAPLGPNELLVNMEAA